MQLPEFCAKIGDCHPIFPSSGAPSNHPPEALKEKQEAKRLLLPEGPCHLLAAGPPWVAGARSLAPCTRSSAVSRKVLSAPASPLPPPGACLPHCGSLGGEQTPNLSNLSDVIVSTHLGPRSPVPCSSCSQLPSSQLPYSTPTCQSGASPGLAWPDIGPQTLWLAGSSFTPNERRGGSRSQELKVEGTEPTQRQSPVSRRHLYPLMWSRDGERDRGRL